MTFERKIVSEYNERGRQVIIRVCAPCLLVEVNGKDLGPFYDNIAAARGAATRHVDAEIKAEAEKAKKEADDTNKQIKKKGKK